MNVSELGGGKFPALALQVGNLAGDELAGAGGLGQFANDDAVRITRPAPAAGGDGKSLRQQAVAGKDGDGGVDGDNNDELYDDAVRLVFEFGKASTSLLQRRLRIGYGRAAHLIDMMYNDGLVGPADGSKPREILKSPNWINEVDAAIR